MDPNAACTKSFTPHEKQQLAERLGLISNKKVLTKVLKILIVYHASITQNENGVFFDLAQLTNEVLTKIQKIVAYYLARKSASDTANSDIHTSELK